MGGAIKAGLLQMTTPNTVYRPTASATLAAYQQVVEAVPNESADIVITLPSAGEVPGKIFCIRSNGNATYEVNVAFPDEGPSDIELAADNDEVVAYSSGFRWYVLAKTVAGSYT